ncbi:MAG TPA: LuxR C-terminal-related transcriptional regulator [Ramlibacter sp.]|uniref:LuxR C-terminal-related transcriptional regulator n=1 Tax=Ramlibacter sp. TaxID=1917967 RepID=UPI002C923294|nr:LuxR C-terminal-related transcriptional regulator [Ramlibacter sp.]HVZ44098.1 LuxR C-terminal-related transcriptional regulator [Ramlibacter sp.]
MLHEGVSGAGAAPGTEGLGAGLAQLMDEWAHGVVVVNLEGRMLYANQAACNEFARRQVGEQGARVLQTLHGDDARSLQEALAKAGDGKRSLVALALGTGPVLSAAVLPLKTDSGVHSGVHSSVRRAALVFARASVCESLMLCFFARSHGLTHTEELVLGILCQGFSAPEIAEQLQVAVSTVRSHVRSLCAKTRSSGVRELVKRVALLPPVVPALRQEAVH